MKSIDTEHYRGDPVCRHRRPPIATTRMGIAALGGTLSIVAALAFSAEPVTPPRWKTDLHLGQFKPELDNWETFYGDDKSNVVGATQGYTPTPFLEFGLDAATWAERGAGYLPQNNRVGGKVLHEQAMLGIYGAVRAQLRPDQRVIPYVGGGYAQVYYRLSSPDATPRRGDIHGSYFKGGLHILLNPYDPDHARAAQLFWDIEHSYLTVEARRLDADTRDIDGNHVELGGDSITVGITLAY